MNAKVVPPRLPVLSFCALLACVLPAQASTVVPMDLKTLADHAAQVLIGTVRSVSAEAADERGGIESRVELEQVVYLKGSLSPTTPQSADTFVLRVPGGTLGDRSMRVCCAPQFAAGERRILFLLPTYKTFPTVGLWQGSFLVVPDGHGVDRVYQEGMIPVTRIGPDWFAETHACPAEKASHRLVGARGVRLVRGDSACANEPPMTLDAFLSAVRPILDASRDHHLTQPAGRRVPADLSAVPLVPAGRRPPTQADTAGKDAELKPAAIGGAER